MKKKLPESVAIVPHVVGPGSQLARPQPGATVPPAVSFLAGFSGESLRAMRASLQVVAGLFSDADPTQVDYVNFRWGDLERAHVRRVRELLSERFAPATAKRHFAALRGVLREAESRAAEGVRGPKGSSPEKGRALSRAEIDALLNAATAYYSDFRAAELRAMVAVGYAGGLRREEIHALDTGDWDGVALTVRFGKGKKSRKIKLAPRASGLVDAWLAVRGGDPGPMFYGRSNRAERRRISYGAVDARLRRLAELAQVPSFSPHDLRRTFVTRILEATGDLRAAQLLAGHASSKTTERYDKRGQEVLDAASTLID